MHRPVVVATLIVCLVTPLFGALYAQTCLPPSPPPISLYNPEICANATNRAWTTSGLASYAWTATHGSIVASDTSGNVTFSSDGTGDVALSVTVTDSNGCPSTNTVTVPLHTITPPAITTYQTDICPTGQGSATVAPPDQSGTSWMSIRWSVSNGTIISDPTSSNIWFTADSSGQPVGLTVDVIDQEGCSAESTATLPIRTIAPPAIWLNYTSMCSTGWNNAGVSEPSGSTWSNITWSVEHATISNDPHYQYIWFTGDGSGYPIVVHVTVQDDGGCTASSSVAIPLRTLDPPVISVYNGDQPLCPNVQGQAQIPPNGPDNQPWTSIQWTIEHGTLNGAANQATAGFLADGSGETIVLHVTVTADDGCQATATASQAARLITPPAIHPVNSPMCINASNSATVDPMPNGNAWGTIYWSIQNGTINSYASSPTVYFSSDGSGQPVVLSAYVAEPYTNCGTTATVTIPIGTMPAPTIDLAQPQICPTGNDSASVDNLAPGASVEWSVENATLTSDPYSATATFTADGSGNAVVVHVHLVQTDGCMADGSTTVPLSAPLTPPAIHLQTPDICPTSGFNQASIDNPTSGSWTSITWSVDHATMSNGMTANSIYFSGDGSGIAPVVHVTVQDDKGCSATNSATVSIRTLAAPDIHLGTPDICPTNGFNQASIDNPATGYWTNIVWSVDHGTMSNGMTANSIYFSGDGSGIAPVVHVTVQDDRGCTATSSATVSIRTIAAPDIHLQTPDICPTNGFNQASIDNPATGYWTNIVWSVDHGTMSNGMTANSIYFSGDGSGIAPVVHVTVQDDRGCTATSSATVSIRTIAAPDIHLQTPDICPTNGFNQASIDNPATGYWTNIVWSVDHGTMSNGMTANSIYFSGDGSGIAPVVHVTVQDDRGCTATNSATVTIRTIAAPDIHLQTPDICPTNGFNQASIDNPATGYWTSVTWSVDHGTMSNGMSANSIYFSGDGSGIAPVVHVTVQDDRGCTATNSATVSIRTIPPPAVTASGPTSFCSGGSVTLTAPAGFTNYLWSNGQTTQSIVAGASGNYSVTVTDASGCSATSAATTVLVDSLAAPPITFNVASFCPETDVVATVPTGYASYNWSASAGLLTSGQGTNSFTISHPGASDLTVSVVVTDANGCSVTSSAVLPARNFPKPTVSVDATRVCLNGVVHATSSDGPYTSYSWSVDNGTIVSGDGTSQITFSPNGSGLMTVYLTVHGTDSCFAYSDAVSVEVDVPSATVSASGPTTFCAGGNVTLIASSASSYLWSNGATTQAITVNASGNYSVTVTDANGCSATSAATAVTVNPLPTPTINASGATTFCAGGSVTLTASSASSYRWSNGATTQAITVNASGNYSVTVTDANGCSATSAATSVTVNPLPAPTISASGPTTFCAGGSVTLTASSASSYLWSNGATTQAITVNASGNYSVTVTDVNGCSGTSSATTVTVNPLPTPTISTSGATTFCEGGNVTLTASAASSYHWVTGATTQSITVNVSGSYSVTVTDANGCTATSAPTTVTVNRLQPPSINAYGSTTFCAGGNVTLMASSASSYLWSNGATTQAITVNASGNYSVTVTDANGCNATSSATTVTVNPLPTPTISASGATTFCAGGSVTLTASAASSYLWSNGATTQAITANASGNYSVTVTNANGCSATSASTAVTVNPLPTPTVSASGPTTFCAGGSVTLTASSASSYLWSNGATTQSITVNASGNYSVTVTNANGCSATSAATSVIVNANPATPSITAGGPTTFCQGGSVTLTASAASSYHWSNGATTQSIVVSSGGTFTVTVTNASGCTSAQSAPVTVTVNPSTTITQQPASVTIPKNTTTTLSVTATGTGTLTYQWYNPTTPNNTDTSRRVGTNSPTFTTPKLAHGTYYYYVVVTGSCGSVASSVATITAN